MADGVVSLAVEKLSNALAQEADLLFGVRDRVEWLRMELRWMECFLKDADAKLRRPRQGNELVTNWVREVKELAHRSEDIIDTFMTEIGRRRPPLRGRTGIMGRIRRYASIPPELRARHKVGVQIEGLRAKIDQIKTSRETYGLVNLGEAATDGESSRSATDEALQARRRIYPHLDGETVAVGLDARKHELLEQLLDVAGGTTRRFVLSIVGPGGLGKTTLANKIYNSPEIRARFGARACLSVSQDHKFGELLKNIAKQVMGSSSEELQRVELDDLRERLYHFLKKSSYFIVLDDVWRTDVWKQIRTALPDVNNGSRVLITTRLMEVAISADPGIPPYPLPFLNPDESWQLFLTKAFPANQDLRCPQELEDIGRQLVKRCGGLPLALLVLGGLVSRKDPNPAAWTRVAERIDWASTVDGEESLKILGLSYDDLPHHHLRSCFRYLGVFPEDSEIEAAVLTRLWIAEGLIPQTEGQIMEDRAEAYLEELVQRSMIQVAYKKWDVSTAMYRIHDLFRDLCIREAAREDESCNLDGAQGSIMRDNSLRRLALHSVAIRSGNECWRPPSRLRSLLAFREGSVTIEIISGLKLLRVIHLQGIENIQSLPEGIGGMNHLRYLSLRGCQDLLELPSSIGNLSNLQTLDVKGTGVMRLPKALGKMQALRHLHLPDGCVCPPNTGNLTNLQTIKCPDTAGGWIERGLENLFNVRDLSAWGLKATQGKVFLDSLGKLKCLSSLELYYTESILTEFITGLSKHNHLHLLTLDGPMSQRQLPDHHEFPSNLTTISLLKSKLERDPMATLEKLPNLMFLELQEAYEGKDMVCTTGGFPRLQGLLVLRLDGLEHWQVEAGAMLSLTSLSIRDCWRLAALPEGLQHVTSLRSLKVYDIREEFRGRLRPDVGEDWYKIQHVPSITVDKF